MFQNHGLSFGTLQESPNDTPQTGDHIFLDDVGLLQHPSHRIHDDLFQFLAVLLEHPGKFVAEIQVDLVGQFFEHVANKRRIGPVQQIVGRMHPFLQSFVHSLVGPHHPNRPGKWVIALDITQHLGDVLLQILGPRMFDEFGRHVNSLGHRILGIRGGLYTLLHCLHSLLGRSGTGHKLRHATREESGYSISAKIDSLRLNHGQSIIP